MCALLFCARCWQNVDRLTLLRSFDCSLGADDATGEQRRHKRILGLVSTAQCPVANRASLRRPVWFIILSSRRIRTCGSNDFINFASRSGSAANNLREWFRTQPTSPTPLDQWRLGFDGGCDLGVGGGDAAITSASEMDALGNGGFEQGFRHVNGCGVVGNHWDCFTNGGAAAYGFYDDQWESTVYEGKSSQLIEINTKNMAAGDNDRYAGISQTARVVPGEPYKFSLRGMIRSTNSEGDPWRYSVQVGWLNRPQGDWQRCHQLGGCGLEHLLQAHRARSL